MYDEQNIQTAQNIMLFESSAMFEKHGWSYRVQLNATLSTVLWTRWHSNHHLVEVSVYTTSAEPSSRSFLRSHSPWIRWAMALLNHRDRMVSIHQWRDSSITPFSYATGIHAAYTNSSRFRKNGWTKCSHGFQSWFDRSQKLCIVIWNLFVV